MSHSLVRSEALAAPAVIAAVAGESSLGALAAPRRAVAIAASTVPIVVAVDKMEMEDPVALIRLKRIYNF
jgi:hypothetical protein